MLQITFIALLNQTNSIISEILDMHFDSEITFIDPGEFFSEPYADQQESPDLFFVDTNTSSGFGNVPENVSTLNQWFPDTPVLVMHPYDEKKFSESLLEAGANGIISITPTEEELVEAVREILSGNTYLGFSY